MFRSFVLLASTLASVATPGAIASSGHAALEAATCPLPCATACELPCEPCDVPCDAPCAADARVTVATN
jgi:hypothetical protein